MVDIVLRDVPADVVLFWTQCASRSGLPIDAFVRESLVARARNLTSEKTFSSALQSELPDRQGQKWSLEEDKLIAGAFQSGTPIKQLALEQQRTPGAIRSRLTRLGLLSPTYANDA